jgi:hypothetical protein
LTLNRVRNILKPEKVFHALTSQVNNPTTENMSNTSLSPSYEHSKQETFQSFRCKLNLDQHASGWSIGMGTPKLTISKKKILEEEKTRD